MTTGDRAARYAEALAQFVNSGATTPLALAVAAMKVADAELAEAHAGRAVAWDEGWAKCSDWWHANAIGESHSVDTQNPYRATLGSEETR